jgi:hypothetical protein
MGWTFFSDSPRETRAQIIERELTQPATDTNPNAWGFHSLSERGSTVYAIAWRQPANQPRIYFGVVVLTSRKRGEFGYKDMDESMGPYYYDMPLRMLDQLEALAPLRPDDINAQAWRDRVRQHHIHKRKKHADIARTGDIVRFSPNDDETFVLVAPCGPRRGWVVRRVRDDLEFRAPARHMARRIPVTA